MSNCENLPASDYYYSADIAAVKPFAWPALSAFFGARAIDGVEQVQQWVERSVRSGAARGTLSVNFQAPESVKVEFRLDQEADMRPALAKVEALLDLDAQCGAIESHLSMDTRLALTVAANPGLRVPGSWDSFELAVRAIVGQQITVAGAGKILARLCGKFGSVLPGTDPGKRGPCYLLFPQASQLAGSDLSSIGLTGARAQTLQTFCNAVADGAFLFDHQTDPEQLVRQLLEFRGIGVWTANYIAMRTIKYKDAFPSNDSGLLSAARRLHIADTHRSLDKAAEKWRPWRAYAAMHLWRSLAD